jgi:hypothetical protein
MEKWNTEMMGLEEEKRSNMTFSTFATHHSIIPTFNMADIIRGA